MLPRPFVALGSTLALLLSCQGVRAEDPYVEGEVLVTFKPSLESDSAQAPSKRHAMRWTQHFDAVSKHSHRPSGMVRDKSRKTADLIKEFQDDPDVETVEPNYIRHVLATAINDPGFSNLWGLSNTGQTVNGTTATAGADTGFLAAWKLAKPDANEVVLGVIDTGVEITHPDLAANIWTNPGETAGNGKDDDGDGYVDDIHGYDFIKNTATITDSGLHGTHVTGTIAAVGRNGVGVIGLDYKAKIIPMKVSNDGENMSTSAVIAAYNYAVKLKQKGVNIVALNASYGGNTSVAAEKTAITALNSAGIILCAAAGNEKANNDSVPSYPANYAVANIISVAALDENNQLASFSNYGATTVDLAAPGVDIYSTVPLTENSAPATVTIGSNSFSMTPLEFSANTTTSGLTKPIYNCNIGRTTDFPAAVKGNIALIKRGTLNFSDKVANATTAGAVGVIIYDNAAPDPTDAGWTLGANTGWIPAFQATQDQGNAIVALTLPATGTMVCVRDPADAYAFLDGTSMATPHVTAAVGFAAMNYPNDTVAQRIARVLNHTTPVAALAGKTVTGGRLNLVGIVDTDGDGLPDWWETQYFGSLAQTGSGDFDGDGVSNLDEFLAATDPTSSSSHLAFSAAASAIDGTGQHFVVSFPSVADHSYVVEWSDDLVAWTTLGQPLDGTGAVIQVTDPADQTTVPHRFYRLHVE